eukprot:jgi/Tetstr1/431264/TSEL_020961.t1
MLGSKLKLLGLQYVQNTLLCQARNPAGNLGRGPFVTQVERRLRKCRVGTNWLTSLAGLTIEQLRTWDGFSDWHKYRGIGNVVADTQSIAILLNPLFISHRTDYFPDREKYESHRGEDSRHFKVEKAVLRFNDLQVRSHIGHHSQKSHFPTAAALEALVHELLHITFVKWCESGTAKNHKKEDDMRRGGGLAAMLLLCAAAGAAGQAGVGDAYYADYETEWYEQQYYDEFDPDTDAGDFGDYEDYADTSETGMFPWVTESADCVVVGTQVTVNGTRACDVTVKGADSTVDQLSGGLDGEYAVFSCYGGHPIYHRQDSPNDEGRLLFFDMFYNDWNFIKDHGGMPEDINPKLIGFGGSGDGEERPQFIPVGGWRLATSLSSAAKDYEEFVVTDLDVSCSNEQGVNVRFEGEVRESKYASAYLRASHSNRANDNFYDSHATAHSQGRMHSASHGHSHWLRTTVITLLSLLAAGGAALAGVSLVRRHRAGRAARAPSPQPKYPYDEHLTAPGSEREATYTAPNELEALMPLEEGDDATAPLV